MTTILLVFQVNSRHKEITNVYVGLVAHRVESRLYAPDQILDFVKDIEVDLQAVHDTLKGREQEVCLLPFCLSGAMSIPMNPPYCLVYPTSYIKGIEPDHFDTCNSPAGMCLHHCVCHTTLQFSNNDPKERTNYVGSHLILPHGAQYNDRLYPTILELQNHRVPLIDATMGEPYPMEVVSNFRATDLIFKGGDPHATCPILPASQGAHSNQATPTQGGSFRCTCGVPPRLNTPTARVGTNGALDADPIPQLQSAQILHLPRNPLAPRSQPQMIR